MTSGVPDVLKTVLVAAVLSFASDLPAPAQEQPEALRVFAGRGTVVSSPQPLARVSVSDPAIAAASVVSPTQVVLTGVSPGTVTLMLWDNLDRLRTYEVRVEADLGALREVLKTAMPREPIQAAQSGSAIVLTGTVSSKDSADRAVTLAQAYSRNVISMLAETSDQVLLQVRFAEVNKSAVSELGLTAFSTGALDTIGAVTTGQFGGSPLGNVGAVPTGVQRGRDPQAPSLVSGAPAVDAERAPAVFGLSDLLNIFFFRPDLNFGAAIRMLHQRNLLQILAEPNLMARNGREASFLAGGEFPFPILQPSAAGSAVTIQFKEFGVRLKFTPHVLPDGTITLKVVQEVSALDFSNALTISGFVIPAISARRAETEIQLRDGQSFAIAGLIDNRVSEVASKIPGFGDIPIIGKLFRSRTRDKNRTELLAMVTPRIVRPLAPGESPALPVFPQPFLRKDPPPKGAPAPAPAPAPAR